MSDALQADLAAMAEDELERALSLSWRELSPITPWGDTFDGFSPGGRQVKVERNYIWAEAEGGDILCEVAVYQTTPKYDQAARRSRVIKRKGGA